MINFIHPNKLYRQKGVISFLLKVFKLKSFKLASFFSLAFIIFLGFGLSNAFGTNTIVQNLNNEPVCNVHETCPRQILGLTSINIPQAGEYEVRLDISLNSVDEQLNESLYIDFSQNSFNLTPNDPNAGIYRVIPDIHGTNVNNNAYAGLFNLPAGNINLNVYHYANIWNQYPQFKNGNDFSGPESVYIESIKIIPKFIGPCEIELTKEDNTPSVEPGGEINYAINFTNTGSKNCTGSGVLLEDIFDPQITFKSADTPFSQNIPPFLQGHNLWNFGSVAPGESHTVNLTAQVSQSAKNGDIITNKACIWASQFGSVNNEGNWQCTTVDTPVKVPDPVFCELSLTKEALPTVVAPGDDLFYTIHLENTGTANCTGGGVELKEYYDNLTSFVSSDPDPFSGEDTWNFGTVIPGEEHTVEITTNVLPTAQDGDIITNKACVWASEFGSKSTEANWHCVTVDTPVVVENMCVANELPQPKINPTNPTITIGDSLSFDASASTDSEDDSLDFTWLVNGDVATSTDEIFNFTPSAVGEYEISLTAKDQCGLNSTSTSLTVKETEICQDNQPPEPVIDPVNPEILLGDTIDFSGSGSSDSENDDLSYIWLVAGQTADTNIDFTYSPTSTGQFEITLQVSDQCGSAEATTVANVAEINECLGHINPEPVITPANPTITLGNPVSFSSNASTDADGDNLNFEWLVDGVVQTTDADFNFTPSASGIFTIELKAQDQCGEAIQSTTLTVKNPGGGDCQGNRVPVAVAGLDQAGLINSPFLLDASASTDADGDALTYTWEVSDVNFVANGPTTTISFASVEPEKHIANLTVSDACGSSTDSLELNVHNGGGGGGPSCVSQRPEAVAGQDISASPGEEFTLDASLSIDPENDIQTYLWKIPSINFEAQTATTSLSIDTPGKYIATLIVGDICSVDDDIVEIEIVGGSPCPNCGGGPPVNPPTTTPPIITPPGVVLGQATSTNVFTAPPSSPRAGSPLPIKTLIIGLLSGIMTFIMTYTLYRQKELKNLNKKVSLYKYNS